MNFNKFPIIILQRGLKSKYILIVVYMLTAANIFGQLKTIQHQYEAPELEILTYHNHDKDPGFRYHLNPTYDHLVNIIGLRADAYITGLIAIGKFKLGLMLSMPVYAIWETDAFFPDENNSNARDKWLNGWGAGISVSHKIR